MALVNDSSVERCLARAAMYVRSNIAERLTLESIARAAGFSPFHFHRIFRVAFGENLNAFVVRHRLQRAARDLRLTARSITEIGLRCGYDSPSAFGRAFSRAFGQTPSAYRSNGEGAGAFWAPDARPALATAQPRFEEYVEREALALRHVGPYHEVDGVMVRLLDIAVRRGFLPEATVLACSYDSPDLEAHEKLRFDACITRAAGADIAGARADGLRTIVIPGGRHAVFRHRGPYERITHAYDVLVAAWVLPGRIELRDAPFINTYLSDPARVDAADLECDLAIPIM